MLAPHPSTPNVAPTGYDQSVDFSPEDANYINDCTLKLQNLRASGAPIELFEQTIIDEVQAALSKPHEALQLTITAEALGATTNYDRAGELLNILKQNPLLASADQATVKSLENLTGNLWSGYRQGIPEETVASALEDNIRLILDSGGNLYW